MALPDNNRGGGAGESWIPDLRRAIKDGAARPG